MSTRGILLGLTILTGLVFVLLLLVSLPGRELVVAGAIFALCSGALAAEVARGRRQRAAAARQDGADGLRFPVLDEGAMRRAVLRGVLRTALATLIWGLLGLFVLQLVSFAWQSRGDRRSHFERVLGLGLLVANPGYTGQPYCCNTGLTSMELLLFSPAPRAAIPRAEGGGNEQPVALRLNLLGRVDLGSRPHLPRTPLDGALSAGRPAKAATGALIRRLPDPIVALALVELLRPASQLELERVLGRHGRLLSSTPSPYYEVPPVLLQAPYARRRSHEGDFFDDALLSWPEPHSYPAFQLLEGGNDAEDDLDRGNARLLGGEDDESLKEFQAWAAELSDGDDLNLDRIGLPSADTIKEVAREPKVFAFVLEAASKRELLSYLDDPAVRSVNVAEVAFDLSPGVVELHGGERGPRE